MTRKGLFLWPISIRAPLAGSDQGGLERPIAKGIFQSALPLRGATRPPRHDEAPVGISIRAPLAGSDRYIL